MHRGESSTQDHTAGKKRGPLDLNSAVRVSCEACVADPWSSGCVAFHFLGFGGLCWHLFLIFCIPSVAHDLTLCYSQWPHPYFFSSVSCPLPPISRQVLWIHSFRKYLVSTYYVPSTQ